MRILDMVKRVDFSGWALAARPKTLSTALVPFLCGTFLASAQGFPVVWHVMLFAWLSAICIQIGTNYINDAYDYKRGADINSVLGPQRATRAGLLSGALSFETVRSVGFCFFCAALLFGLPLIWQGGAPVLVLLALSVLLGFLYTGGPYPLAYHGLGDFFVFVFYGVLATNAAYWLQVKEVSSYSWLLSLQIGCLCTSMIAINNLRDVAEDAKAAKNTLPVRLGISFGRGEITFMLLTPLALNFLWPWVYAVWLPLLSLPIAVIICLKIWRVAPSSEYNAFLALSGLNMMVFCSLLALGFIIG